MKSVAWWPGSTERKDSGMNGNETVLLESIIQPVAWALLHSLWQGGLVAISLAALLALVPRKKAVLRYAAGCAALLIMFIWPLLGAGSIPEQSPAVSSGSEAGAARVAVAPNPVADGPRVAMAAGPVAAETVSEPTLLPVLPWVFGAWLLGVSCLSLVNLGGWLRVRRLVRSGTGPVTPAWQASLRGVSQRLGISRPIGLLSSAEIDVPAVVGWLRPVVLMPIGAFAGLSLSQVEAILAHELAHIRRHDYLVNLVQTLLETLLFYHPAVWWVSRQVRMEREHCCDDVAVHSCGNRAAYARALTELEGLRMASPQLAMAADGTPLLDRIRRLAGVLPQPRGRHQVWLAGVLLLPLILLIGVAFVGLTPRPAAAASGLDPMRTDDAQIFLSSLAASGGTTAAAPANGTWEITSRDDRIHLRIGASIDGDRWMSGMAIDGSELIGLREGEAISFELRRDAGTFTFSGKYDGQQGSGTLDFTGDPDYRRQLEAMGFAAPSEPRLLTLALHDLSLDFIREIRELGYSEISLDRLLEFRIHDVTPKFIRELAAAGYKDLSADRLVEFQIHDVNPEFVRELAAAGYEDLSADRLVEFQIHDVNPEFVRELAAAGYDDLSASRLVEFQIHDVTPGFVRELAKLGYENIPGSKLVEMRIHSVTPALIRRLADRGFTDLPVDELIRIRIHGIDHYLDRANDN